MAVIPYGRQDITQSDIDCVVDILRSDFLTQGPVCPQFESAVARYVGAVYAIAVNSATSALHLACMALELKEGGILWTTPITFVASSNCALYCGATVDFVDIDPITYNICPQKLNEKLKIAERTGSLPNIVVVVHLCGQSCDMQSICELSKKYGFKIVEDASHAIGGKYLDDFVGNCKYSDITIFSFHPVKIITTAEGGMLLTNNRVLAKKLSLLRSHGITRSQNDMTKPSEGDWYYQQLELGYNYRMNEIQAALGLNQLERLELYVDKRQKIASMYNEALKSLPLTLPIQASYAYSAYHLYVIRLQLDKIKKTRREVFDELRGFGIAVNVHYIPVHTQPYYMEMGFSYGDFPEAEKYYSEALSLPIYPGLNQDDFEYVVGKIFQVLQL